MDFHFCADDSQLYIAFESTVEGKLGALAQIEMCTKEIDISMVKNRLKLNGNKTELLIQYQSRVREHRLASNEYSRVLASEPSTRFDSLLASTRHSYHSLLTSCESCESNVTRNDSQVSNPYAYYHIS